MKKAMLALALAACVQVAVAQEYPVLGAGASSCGRWLQEMPRSGRASDSEQSTANLTWVQGYITGMNHAFGIAQRRAVRTLDKMPDSAAMAAFVTKHCREKPLDDIADAAASLYLEILNRSNR